MASKHRWKHTAAGDRRQRFTYRGDGKGGILFFRYDVPFHWKPLFVDRELARRLCDFLNTLKGKDLEGLGRPACDKFYSEHKDKTGPAEPGTKET